MADTRIEFTDIDELTIERDDRTLVATIFSGIIFFIILAYMGIIPVKSVGGGGELAFIIVAVIIAGVIFFSGNLYFNIVVNRKTQQVTVERIQWFIIKSKETFTIQHIRLKRERRKNDGAYEYNAYIVLGNHIFNLSTASDEADMLADYELVKNFLEEGKEQNTKNNHI